MAGIEVTKDSINRRAGSIAAQLFGAFEEVRKIKTWLDVTPDSTLTGTHAFTQAEVDNIKSAYADLVELADVWEGSKSLLTAKDFRTFPRRLVGIGQY